jgi:hypothetical protein
MRGLEQIKLTKEKAAGWQLFPPYKPKTKKLQERSDSQTNPVF